ncbi:MAG: lytic transglycosylase domain-containing protein [Burkholderiaceae bacterium]|nr:lytic transglycosylase domain-containing protein [Burkholderiaceae bacterium]
MTDPNRTSPTVMQGWESLKQRTTTFVVIGLLALSTLLTDAGRSRLAAWSSLAVEALSPRQLNSVYSILPTNLTVEQRRVARWIANRHRVAMGAVEQLVAASFETASNNRIDPYLLLAVISIESAFNPFAESAMGAVGLMQIMPKAHADKLKAFGGEKLALDPWVNMQVGAQILREYLDRFGSETAALRAYVGALEQPTEYPQRVFQIRERLLAAAVGRVLA